MKRLAARELRKSTTYCIARDREAEDKKDGVHDCNPCCHAGKVALPPPQFCGRSRREARLQAPFPSCTSFNTEGAPEVEANWRSDTSVWTS